jgi:hypothetical protein
MTEREEELVFTGTICMEKQGTARTFLTRPCQSPHIIPGLFEWMDFLTLAIIDIDRYF